MGMFDKVKRARCRYTQKRGGVEGFDQHKDKYENDWDFKKRGMRIDCESENTLNADDYFDLEEVLQKMISEKKTQCSGQKVCNGIDRGLGKHCFSHIYYDIIIEY